MKPGDYAAMSLVAESFRKVNAGQRKVSDPSGYKTGPSGIRRVSKFINRYKKAVSHEKSQQARRIANMQRGGKKVQKEKT